MMHLPIAAFAPAWWVTIGAPIANHLWQSTLFAGVAGLLTRALRKNRAQARYALWFVASAKFLIPFSLLVGAGSHLGQSKVPAINHSGFTVVMQQIGQPFAAADATPASASTISRALEMVARLLPTLLLVAWIGGCAAVILWWWLRWQRVAAARREAWAPSSGRELEALRRLERSAGIAQPIKLLVSESALQPGIVGIFRPVLLLPAGIAARLTDAQLEAIIRHELCHVRRRDNAAAVVHMVVEALFWFHPLIWWIGARLVDERERACDEEVLRLGSAPQAYAQGILKVCEFYLESPLRCAAGVTGSNLKKRIEAIMIQRTGRKLNLGQKLLIVVMAAAAVIGPVAIGVANPAPSRARSSQAAVAATQAFESVSITPNRSRDERRRMIGWDPATGSFQVVNLPLQNLIGYAYGFSYRQISGGPAWVSTERYDISAKLRHPVDQLQIKLALQQVLTEQFRLASHRETRDLPVYELVVGLNGPKLKAAELTSDPMRRRGMGMHQPGHLVAKESSMENLTGLLGIQTGRIVVDKTGLQGIYDFTLDWRSSPEMMASAGEVTPSSESVASISTALREQLGLELKPQTSPMETLIIDDVEEVVGEQ
jgi:bla regulator protein BlaR1